MADKENKCFGSVFTEDTKHSEMLDNRESNQEEKEIFNEPKTDKAPGVLHSKVLKVDAMGVMSSGFIIFQT